MTKLYQLALITALAIPSTAFAQSGDDAKTGFYGGLSIGAGNLSDTNVTYYDEGGTLGGTGDEDQLTSEFDFKSAAIVGGVIGYDFGTIRGDVEVSYARNKLKALTIKSLNGEDVTLTDEDRDDLCDFLEADECGGSGNRLTVAGSRARQLNALANVWLDIPLGNVVTPYVGGGIGIAGFEVDGEGKAKFAWQLGAGAAFALSDAVEITADYRHREVGKTNIIWDEFSGIRIGKLKTDSFSAGIRFRF